MKFLVARLEDWDSVAKKIAETLKPGTMLLLSGPLGAGKTTFVQSMAKSLGSKKIPKSPSFSLVRTYQLKNDLGIKTLVHVDAYRIDSEDEVLALGLDELVGEETVLAIEWPENLGSWANRLRWPRIEMRIDVDPRHGTRHVRLR